MLLSELWCAQKLSSDVTAPTYRLGRRCLVLTMPRAELELSERLPPAEVDVCGLALEGLSHEQISLRRRRSKRTVANQLASAFRRMRVSGRLELAASVARMHVCGRHAAGTELPAPTP